MKNILDKMSQTEKQHELNIIRIGKVKKGHHSNKKTGEFTINK